MAKLSTCNPAPPATLQELRDFITALSRNELQLSLGAKAKMVLGQLAEQPGLAAVNTITELADTLGVNPSTLSRLARTLGYEGFSEFQRVFRDALTSGPGRFYSQRALKLMDASALPPEQSLAAPVSQLFRESIINLEATLSQLDAASLDDVAMSLSQARRVFVYGVRQIHAVASLLVYGLGLLRPDVGMLDAPGQGVAENLAHMTPDDVLVVASTAPYSRAVAEAADIARSNGITVIAITDYRSSPLAAQAHHSFFVPHQSSFISNSIGAYIVLCESLINLVARKLGAEGVRSLERHECFINTLRVETE